MRNTPPSELATAQPVEFREIPPAKRPFFQAFRDLENEIYDLLPDDSQPDGCLTYFFDSCNPWSGAMHIARLKIREDGTTASQAKTITAKTCQRIKRGIAKYQASFPDKMAELREEQERRAPARAALLLAIQEREQREADEEECRQRMQDEFPHFIEGDDYLIVGGGIVYGERDPPTPKERTFKAAFEASLRSKDGADMPEAQLTNGKANGKHYDFEPAEHDRMPSHFAGWTPPHYDLFGTFAVPALERKHVPDKYRDIVFSNALCFGSDAGALWESIVTAWSSFIPADKMRIRPVSTNEGWKEAPRLWTLIVGEAGTGKSPVMRLAVDALLEIDAEAEKEHAAETMDYEQRKAATKKNGEALDVDKPVRVTAVVDGDFSTEGLQDVGMANPGGVLIFSDEFRAIFDAALRFSNANNTSRAFLLKSHNSDFAKSIRANGKIKSGYPSYSMLGSMQPDLLHEIASDVSSNDGMTHRLNVIFINKDALPKATDEAPSHPMSLHHKMLDAAYRRLTHTTQTITLSQQADAVRRKMDDWIAEQREIYSYGNPPLAVALLKWKGHFARRCLIMHAIEHYDAPRIVPSTVSAETAQQVMTYMTEFLFEHTKAFYNLTAANDEHTILRSILEHALVHDLRTFSANDLTQGSRQLAKIDRSDLKRFMYKLEALGYGKILMRQNGKTVRHDSVAIEMNPFLFARNQELAQKLRERNALWEANWKAAQKKPKPAK